MVTENVIYVTDAQVFCVIHVQGNWVKSSRFHINVQARFVQTCLCTSRCKCKYVCVIYVKNADRVTFRPFVYQHSISRETSYSMSDIIFILILKGDVENEIILTANLGSHNCLHGSMSRNICFVRTVAMICFRAFCEKKRATRNCLVWKVSAVRKPLKSSFPLKKNIWFYP